MNTDYYAVIMAGGVGSRFWPVSKTDKPKQFLDLMGSGQTLIQKTYDRLGKIIPKKNIFILTNDLYENLVKQQLPCITDRQIVLEPVMRNTAPCILLSALKIQKENPNASMIVAPSDHWIEDESTFTKEVKTAFEVCRQDHSLMTLGIRPTFPHTGYGYIQYSRIEESLTKPVHKFTEKPNYQTAKFFLDAGNYLWNAGIFIWQTQSILKAFEKWLPKMYRVLSEGKNVLNTCEEKKFIINNYGKVQNISIDYGIMEKAGNVEVLPATFDWNDLGSWGSLYDKLEKDCHKNVVINAKTHLDNSEENIIYTPKGKIVVIKGLSNHIIVDNEEVLLIYPKTKEQEIKEVRSEIEEKFGEELV